MTTMITDTTATTASSSASLKSLTWLEVRRYARHPVFLVGLALAVWGVWTTHDDMAQVASPLHVLFLPVLLIGLLGTMVGYRLARIMDRASAVTDAAPVDRTRRTAALCLATLLPASIGLALATTEALARTIRFGSDSWTANGVSNLTIVLAFLGCAAACAGGPLFGIVTARWTPFPGAGLLAMVLLVAWTLLSTYGLTFTDPTRLSALIVGTTPGPVGTSSDGANMPEWVAEGWPLAHVLYLVSLCFLGAVFAMVKDAQGQQRRTLWRVFAGLAVLTVAMVLLTALPEPVRIPLQV